mmetsp:Transcript_85668/g.228414  ORF Transcript_85668/g.228414 Transcript_85668/m.228414 type:complete len:663 (-) Transcript_85668:20-2008(-)|eukprot:CAMPEP_0113687858 /NCGR_PEP_ID=MMETSP0038_2-20120614/16187_1 /TAXON_ID=2898 /ORGANISM="Cryptomonas paramecium" /LENGTH=662 /DNA_ID=CAMNT_0000608555 /DNA_START=31 /DNA_END=2019 /DNA_ORIENTATION=+ /assembly_acc=CAM_ASM_000170
MRAKVAAGFASLAGLSGYGYYSVFHKRSNHDYDFWDSSDEIERRKPWWMPSALLAATKSQENFLLKCEDGTSVLPWMPPTREEQKQKLKTEYFDILVIGGGATGSGVAMDAASRGLKTAMVEQEDFASGTSSRSTKLIHGGIRYLALAFQKKSPPNSIMDLLWNLHYDHSMMQVVMHDLHERAFMIKSAPYMTQPLPMMFPLHKWWEIPLYWVSGKMYDLIAGSRRTVPQSHFISRDEALYQFPTLKSDGLIGAVVLYDGQQNDTRMNLSIALTAAQSGATVVNHTEVLNLLTTGTLGSDDYKVVGARVKDSITGEKWDIRAKQVINATGPFADSVRKMADPEASDIIVTAKGSHLILPDHFSPDHMGCIWFTRDGRVLYLLPWEGSTIAGTTDIREPVTRLPETSSKEVEFILDECNRTLARPLNHSHVRAAWAGLRPLVRQPGSDEKETKKLARDHVVDVVRGSLISICGGKWTTYRKMAQDAVDHALATNPSLKADGPCVTDGMQLIGADRAGIVCNQSFDKVVVTLREKYDMDRQIAKHLMRNYGTRALMVAEVAKTMAGQARGSGPDIGPQYARLCSKYPMLEAEVVFACRQEYAMTAVDVLARRTRLAFLDSKAAEQALPRVLDLMQKELGWSRSRKEQERQDAQKFLVTMGLPSQ